MSPPRTESRAYDSRLPVVSGRPRTETHRLTEANAALVELALRRYFPGLTDPDDLADARAEGMLALLRAAERFDSGKGFAFSSYAVECIRLHVIRWRQAVRGDVSEPRYVRNAAHVIARAEATLRTEMGRDPTDAELLARSALPPSVAAWALQSHRRPDAVRLDAPLGEDSGASLGELLADTRPGPEAALLEREGGVWSLLCDLPRAEADVLRSCYEDEERMADIARARGVSRQRVKQIHDRALRTLRAQCGQGN